MTDRLIRPATLAVVAVAAAIISCQHACELVTSHGESCVTAVRWWGAPVEFPADAGWGVSASGPG